MQKTLSEKLILIKGGTIRDPQSSFNATQKDILSRDGAIVEIADNITNADAKILDATGCWVIPGLFDLRSEFKDPGMEYKEDLDSGADCAEFGGYTGVLIQPNTIPTSQSKSSINYIRTKSNQRLVDLYCCGATTVDLKGSELAEMYDMHMAGALAFSNGNTPYANGGVLIRALLYCKSFNGLVFSHAEDDSVAANGSVNESANTIHTGLKKRTALAELLQIQKEIEIVRYTNGRLHFSHISTDASLKAIIKAKADGLSVSCDVSIWNLLFDDEQINKFDSNYKLLPPLRGAEDRIALIKGVQDGHVDAIISDHNPQNIERKKVEFDFAAFGASGLHTLLSLYNSELEKSITLDAFLKATSIKPRELLGVDKNPIEKNAKTELAIFDAHIEWKFDAQSNPSKSSNNPYFGKVLKGKTRFIVNGTSYRKF